MFWWFFGFFLAVAAATEEAVAPQVERLIIGLVDKNQELQQVFRNCQELRGQQLSFYMANFPYSDSLVREIMQSCDQPYSSRLQVRLKFAQEFSMAYGLGMANLTIVEEFLVLSRNVAQRSVQYRRLLKSYKRYWVTGCQKIVSRQPWKIGDMADYIYTTAYTMASTRFLMTGRGPQVWKMTKLPSGRFALQLITMPEPRDIYIDGETTALCTVASDVGKRQFFYATPNNRPADSETIHLFPCLSCTWGLMNGLNLETEKQFLDLHYAIHPDTFLFLS